MMLVYLNVFIAYLKHIQKVFFMLNSETLPWEFDTDCVLFSERAPSITTRALHSLVTYFSRCIFSARRRKVAWGVCLYKTLGLVLSVQSTHAVISGLLDSEFYRPLFSWMAFKDTNASLKSKLLVLIDLISNFQLEHSSSRHFVNVFRSVSDIDPNKLASTVLVSAIGLMV